MLEDMQAPPETRRTTIEFEDPLTGKKLGSINNARSSSVTSSSLPFGNFSNQSMSNMHGIGNCRDIPISPAPS